MKLKVVVHPAEEGGFWAEVPAIAGCATQGETLEELFENLHEAIEGCLSVDIQPIQDIQNSQVLEITI
jgi:predicted RNase H-like HicB family nuclease